MLHNYLRLVLLFKNTFKYEVCFPLKEIKTGDLSFKYIIVCSSLIAMFLKVKTKFNHYVEL